MKNHGVSNYGPWIKSSLISIFVSKVLFEHSHAHLFLSMAAFMIQHKISIVVEECSSQSLKHLLPGSLQEKLADPEFRAKIEMNFTYIILGGEKGNQHNDKATY